MYEPHALCSSIPTVFFCATLTLRGASSETLKDNGENLDIITVFNTTEDVWVYWQTDRNVYRVNDGPYTITATERCDRNTLLSISPQEYNFTRTTVTEATAKGEDMVPVLSSGNYTGKFLEDAKPPRSMMIYPVDDPTTQLQHMVLQYADEGTPTCSVFFIYPTDNSIRNGLAGCEMHIRDSQVDDGPTESCKAFFEKRCNATVIYKPYDRKCKYEEEKPEDDAEGQLEASS